MTDSTSSIESPSKRSGSLSDNRTSKSALACSSIHSIDSKSLAEEASINALKSSDCSKVINLVFDYSAKKTDANLAVMVQACDRYYGFDTVELSIATGKTDTTKNPPKHSHGVNKNSKLLTLYHSRKRGSLRLVDFMNVKDVTIGYLYEITQNLSYRFTHTVLKLKLINNFLQNCDYTEVRKVGHVFRAFCHEVTGITDPKYQTALVHIVKRGLDRIDEFFKEKENPTDNFLTPLHAAFMRLCSNGGYHSLAAKYTSMSFIRPDPLFGTNYATLFIFYYHASILLFDQEDFAKAFEFGTTALVACPWMKSDAVFSRYLLTKLISSNDGSNLYLGASRATLFNPNGIEMATSHMSFQQYLAAVSCFNTNHKYASLYGSTASPQNIVSKSLVSQYNNLTFMFPESAAKALKSKSKTNKMDDLYISMASPAGSSAASSVKPVVDSNPAAPFLKEFHASLPLLSVYQLDSEAQKLVAKNRVLYLLNLQDFYLTVGSDTLTEADKVRDYLPDVFTVDPFMVALTESALNAKKTPTSELSSMNSEGVKYNISTALPGTAVPEALEDTKFDTKSQEGLTMEFVYESVMDGTLPATIAEETTGESEDTVMKDANEWSAEKQNYWVEFKHYGMKNKQEQSKLLGKENELLEKKLQEVGDADRYLKAVIIDGGLPSTKDTILGAMGLGDIKAEQLNCAAHMSRGGVINIRPESSLSILNYGKYEDGDSFMENSEEAGRQWPKRLYSFLPDYSSETRETAKNEKNEKSHNTMTVGQLVGRRAGEILNAELREYYYERRENGEDSITRGAKRVRSKSGGSLSEEKTSAVGRRRSHRWTSNEGCDEGDEEEIVDEDEEEDEDEDEQEIADVEYEEEDIEGEEEVEEEEYQERKTSEFKPNTRMRTRSQNRLLKKDDQDSFDDDRMDISDGIVEIATEEEEEED